MKKQDIVDKVKELSLPEGSYIVFGSGPMAAAGIREASDVDLFATTEVLQDLKNAGWQQLVKSPGDAPYVYDVYEVHDSWNFSSYAPTLKQLLETATIIDGVPFASLDEVRKWKQSSGRPKDLIDIELIDAYLAQTK